MNIQFLGAVNEVTGSKFLVTTSKQKKILLDCGMYQGKGLETDADNKNLGFEPSEIDYLILSHAHIDHSGLIPYIYKLGFKGTIFCTPATRDLCSIMLPDSGKIQEADTVQFNKKRAVQGLPAVEPIYTVKEAMACMGQFVSIPYDLDFAITPDVTLRFTNNGHLLGSAAVTLTLKQGKKERTLCYTSDIGRYNKQILQDPHPFSSVDYIITESTYGDRKHESLNSAEQDLLMAVVEACAKKKGKLLIPSFAIGRTQDIVYVLNKLRSQKLLPDVDIFVDSPLAVSATNIFRLHSECFKQELQESIKINGDPFGFERIKYIRSVEDSKYLNTYNKPCIIISASGMMEAGRIKHHLANNIENLKNTILVVGYCAPRTLGARIARGDKEVSIFGVKYKVKADVQKIDALSGHADYEELIVYLSCQEKRKLKNLFIVHGEEETQKNYKQHLIEADFKNVYIPTFRETFEIE